MFHLSDQTDDIALIFPFWILRPSGGKPMLVDMGFPEAACAGRGVDTWTDPGQLLAAAGVHPAEIETIVVSHLHWDHFNAPERFPNASFCIQAADIAYFTTHASEPAAHAADHSSVARIGELEAQGRVRRLDGGVKLAPGVHVIKVGGHTPGMQITVCDAGDEQYVLACDAAHFYANFERRTPSALYYRYDEFQIGLDRIAQDVQRGANWFPGHDPAMLERMTERAPGVYRAAPIPATRGSPEGIAPA